MSKAHFRPFNERVKPAKPSDDFPLFPHANGCWAKKILGKLHYFGPWENPGQALESYLRDKDDLHAGRTPRAAPGVLTVKDLANVFLNAKKDAVAAGELSPRTHAGYLEACGYVVKAFGPGRLVSDLTPADFAGLRSKLAERFGPHGLGTRIQCVRCLFKYAFDSELLDRPIRFGPDFKRPSRKTLRLHRAKQGPKLFTAEEVRRMIDAAGVQLRAMLLLAINAGFGNSDCGNLPVSALDLDGGWIDYPRPKTGVARRCPLWPETVAALREAMEGRPASKSEEHAGLVFITKYGLPWHRDTGKMGNRPISLETSKLLKKLNINGRKGLNFYTLRHTFRTVADEAKDPVAADHFMGHGTPNMSSVYRERISDERLLAVSDHVRAWLFATNLPPMKGVADNGEVGRRES
jgi:integrase